MSLFFCNSMLTPSHSSSLFILNFYDLNFLVPTGYKSMELSDISNENCRINRYGYFRATITIVGKAEDQWGRDARIFKAPIHLANARRAETKEEGPCPI